jgi:hypothetical protein
MKPQSPDAQLLHALSYVVGVPMLGGFVGAVVSFGCESIYWLGFGAWPKWSISYVTGPIPPTGLVGLDRIISGLFDGPLSLQLLILVFICAGLSGWVEKRSERAERKRLEKLPGSAPLIWRLRFPDWKSVAEIGDFWQPPKRTSIENTVRSPTSVRAAPSMDDQERSARGVPNVASLALEVVASSPSPPKARREQSAAEFSEPNRIHSSSDHEKWSLWKSANIGLLVSVFTLLLQIGAGRGFELANYAHTASVATVSGLIGQILGVPLIFVLIAMVRNVLYGRQPNSSASTVRGALTFLALLVAMLGALMIYGEAFFSSTEIISGESRKYLVADVQRSCVQRQRALGQAATDAQIEKFCTCMAEKVADRTTYKEAGTEPDASALANLKQKVERAGNACR